MEIIVTAVHCSNLEIMVTIVSKVPVYYTAVAERCIIVETMVTSFVNEVPVLSTAVIACGILLEPWALLRGMMLQEVQVN